MQVRKDVKFTRPKQKQAINATLPRKRFVEVVFFVFPWRMVISWSVGAKTEPKAHVFPLFFIFAVFYRYELFR